MGSFEVLLVKEVEGDGVVMLLLEEMVENEVVVLVVKMEVE